MLIYTDRQRALEKSTVLLKLFFRRYGLNSIDIVSYFRRRWSETFPLILRSKFKFIRRQNFFLFLRDVKIGIC